MSTKNSNKVSCIIDFSRFPLAVLVVFIHYIGIGDMTISASSFCDISSYDAYSFIRVLFSRVISQVAVPAFFLISGYLFYKRLEQWDWNIWKEKVKSRIHTLLIPYLVWITLYVVFCRVLDFFISNDWSVFVSKWHIIGYYYNCTYTDMDNISWLGTSSPTCSPILIPFWFIRDLMFMTILSPFIYFALKRMRVAFLAMLLLAYVSQVWPVIPGISIRALCFFSIGAFFSLYKIKIPKVILKLSYFTTLTLAIACCLTFHSHVYWILLPWFVLSAILSFYDITKKISGMGVRMPRLLVESTFFIFAFHFFLLHALSTFRTTTNMSLGWLLFDYFLIPISCASISIIAYYALKQWCNKVIKVLVGR